MAELVDAADSKSVAHKAWGFDSLYPHHNLVGLKVSLPSGNQDEESCRQNRGAFIDGVTSRRQKRLSSRIQC